MPTKDKAVITTAQAAQAIETAVAVRLRDPKVTTRELVTLRQHVRRMENALNGAIEMHKEADAHVARQKKAEARALRDRGVRVGQPQTVQAGTARAGSETQTITKADVGTVQAVAAKPPK